MKLWNLNNAINYGTKQEVAEKILKINVLIQGNHLSVVWDI